MSAGWAEEMDKKNLISIKGQCDMKVAIN